MPFHDKTSLPGGATGAAWWKIAVGCALLLFTLLVVPSVPATSVVPLTLDQLARAADRIVLGRCLDAAAQDQGGLRVTTYHFAVTQTIKGKAPRSLTVRHFASFLRPGLPLQASVPVYRANEEYLLFLTAESSIGLCAPVGLAQGAFLVRADREGVRRAVNGNGNLGLLPKDQRLFEKRLGRALTPGERVLAGKSPGPIALDALVGLTTDLISHSRK